MEFAFKTIAEFNDFFKDEKTCYQFFEQLRWDNVPVCPHCGSVKTPYKVQSRGKFKDIPSYRCSERACDLPFTVRTGSIFEGSRVEMRKWFQASYEISISKKGISSVELATRIGVSQKTAWFMNHRLRSMMKETNPELLEGTIEIDETYVGGKETNKSKKIRRQNLEIAALHRKRNSHIHPFDEKIPVLGILQRDGKVRVQPVGSARKADIFPLLAENISQDATVVTDGLRTYKTLGKLYKSHVVVNHAKDEWVKGEYSTNSIESFWSVLKRGIIGTFHSVSPKHLQRYCDEFAYRYNTKGLNNVERFADNVMRAHNSRLTYNRLIGKK